MHLLHVRASEHSSLMSDSPSSSKWHLERRSKTQGVPTGQRALTGQGLLVSCDDLLAHSPASMWLLLLPGPQKFTYSQASRLCRTKLTRMCKGSLGSVS